MNEVELNLEATMQGRQVRFHRELCLPKEKYLKIKINNFLDAQGSNDHSIPLSSKNYPLSLPYVQYIRLQTEGSGHQSDHYCSVLFCAGTAGHKQIVDTTSQPNISCDGLTSIHTKYKMYV